MGESSDLGSQLSPNTINHYEHSKYSKKSGSNMSDISKPTLNRKPSDVFENTKTKSYSFKANIVPPYVLDTLSQAHYKDQLNNNNVNTNQAEINPAVKSIHVKKSTTHHQGNNGNTHNNHHQTNNNSNPNNINNNHNNNNGNDDDDYLSFSNDPFIKSMDHNWNKFLSSIQQPSTYTKDLLTFDENTQFENKLEGSWGGEERLKSALLGSPSSDEDTFTNEKSFSVLSILGLFGYKRNKSLNNHLHNKGADESPKVRSKAGYWMSDEKRADLLPSLNRIFVINPLVPLLLRICIMVFSACALALACTIFQYSNNKYEGKKVSQQPSTIMAIIVQCFALVYLVYISYDEYSGKPLGLRAPLGKMRLIMLDLLFIILSSANLSLTFNSLYDDQWVCASDGNIDKSSSNYTPTVASLCRRQRGLAAFLFLILGLWVLTFTISIIRVIDRVSIIGQRND